MFRCAQSCGIKRIQAVAGATVTRSYYATAMADSNTIELKPDPLEPGTYTGEYTADKAGAYVAEIAARSGQNGFGPRYADVPAARRRSGKFRRRAEQRSSRKTFERYQRQLLHAFERKACPARSLFPKPGITAHDNLDIWDMPILFPLVLLIRGGEWLLRRKWGVV